MDVDKPGSYNIKLCDTLLFQSRHLRMATAQALLTPVSEPVKSGGTKITIVGVGAVGMACAFSLIAEVSIYSTKQTLDNITIYITPRAIVNPTL